MHPHKENKAHAHINQYFQALRITLCPDFKGFWQNGGHLSLFQIIQNLDTLQNNLLMTIQNLDILQNNIFLTIKNLD